MTDKTTKKPLYLKIDRECYRLIQVMREEMGTTQIAVIEHAILSTYGNDKPVDAKEKQDKVAV